ncbi:hypothetical protein DL96DRAFT_1564049 [Flagelloscypha sp. PMI_526]|nr:hypothetical protein DL96DRAFT_1564049 [Flagelloscypha sp. PMI_526]
MSQIPPEIWAQILAFLPQWHLRRAKRVNRVFYHACRILLLSDLDIVPMFTKQSLDEQLQVLRKRLTLAKSHPGLIKSIRIMPSGVMGDYLSWVTTGKNPVQFFRRLFRRMGGPELHPASSNASDLDEGLAALAPSLVSLKELYIVTNTEWYGRSSPADLVLKVNAPQLTVLSLHIWPNPKSPRVFSSNMKAGMFVLPRLRAFRLSCFHSPIDGFELLVQKFTSGSSLLEEVEYNIRSDVIQGTSSSYSMNTPMHPHLKVFKWTSITFRGQSASLPPSYAAHAFQFDVVHLDPLPSLDACSSLNIARLVELRVHLLGCSNVAEFCAILIGAEQLVILEVLGFRPYDANTDPADLLPGTGLGQLKQLHLEIILPLFTVQSLGSLASKTPHLRKLALIVKPHARRWSKTELRANLGVVFRHWKDRSTIRLGEFEGVLTAISQKVPSITSFYGTGGLRLSKEIENDIDQKWGVEWWSCVPFIHSSVSAYPRPALFGGTRDSVPLSNYSPNSPFVRYLRSLRAKTLNLINPPLLSRPLLDKNIAPNAKLDCTNSISRRGHTVH